MGGVGILVDVVYFIDSLFDDDGKRLPCSVGFAWLIYIDICVFVIFALNLIALTPEFDQVAQSTKN